MVKYRIYIDEVGNPDLDSSADPNHRFLSLTGAIIDLAQVEAVVHPQMEALKAKYFGSHPDDPVVFHRKDVLNCKPPFQVLADPVLRTQFDEELLTFLTTWNYRLITVCLDKRKHQETYTIWRFDPYHYCMTVLLERFVLFLERQEEHGDAMAESRGGKEDMRLKASFARLVERGTDYVSPAQFAGALTSTQLKVKPKANNIAGLQLADLLAHPSRNEILAEQGLLGREIAPYAQQIIRILQSKYDQQDGRIRGIGKKFL